MDILVLNALLAAIHYLALAVGFWGLSERTIAAKKLSKDPSKQEQWLPIILRSDNLWGVAALLWIGSGLLRAFGGYEKSQDFYLSNGFFHAKMSIFSLIFAFELMPMIRLIRTRVELKRHPGCTPLSSDMLRGLFRAGMIEIHLLVVMVVFATLMARGAWFWG